MAKILIENDSLASAGYTRCSGCQSILVIAKARSVPWMMVVSIEHREKFK